MKPWGIPNNCQAQSGMALPISLMMIVILTIMGMSAMRGGATSEKIASNYQQKTITSEAAKSGIETVWDAAYLKSAIADHEVDQFDEPEPIPQPATITRMADDYDIDTGKGTIDISGEVTVQYCGEEEPPGGDLNANESAPSLVGVLIDVTSTADIQNTKARTLVVQRAAMTSLQSGRRGACTTY